MFKMCFFNLVYLSACFPGDYRCGNGQCLTSAPGSCNMMNECGDWSDELDCGKSVGMQLSVKN